MSDAPLPPSPLTTPVRRESTSQFPYSPISDAPLPPSPVDASPPARRASESAARSLEQKREEERRALQELRDKYISTFTGHTEDSIIDRWGTFCTHMDQLCEELRSLADKYKPQRPTRGHRTRQWQRRRGGDHRSQRQDRNTDNTARGTQNRERGGQNNRRPNVNNGSIHRNNSNRTGRHNSRSDRHNDDTEDRRPGHRAAGRQRWIEQAKRVQAQYCQNSKNCIQKLLNPNEERETCQIPLDQIH